MANTATVINHIPAAFARSRQGFSRVTQVSCVFDTVDSDLAVFTPSLATNYGAIIGVLYEEAAAHTLTFKSASTTLVTLERTTYDPFGKPVGTGGFVVIGKVGEALNISCGTAVISSMLVYCVEFPSILFNG